MFTFLFFMEKELRLLFEFISHAQCTLPRTNVTLIKYLTFNTCAFKKILKFLHYSYLERKS